MSSPTKPVVQTQYAVPPVEVFDEIARHGAAEPLPPQCDLIMKGGITSGIVYPPAAVELARDFRFRNIGGTSAGAIVAAFTAAAEYRRRTAKPEDRGAGFRALAQLPATLGDKGSGLEHIFSPNPKTQGLFHLIFEFINTKSTLGKLWVPLKTSVKWFPFWTFIGLIPALLLAYFLWDALWLPASWDDWTLLICGGFSALAVGAFCMLLVFVWRVLHLAKTLLPSFNFGLTGISDIHGSPSPLGDWLHKTIQAIAGKSVNEPLTYRDLWLAGLTGDELAVLSAEIEKMSDDSKHEKERHEIFEAKFRGMRAINLEMVTTNLSQGRPYVLPFRVAGWHYSKSEHRRLFPPEIGTYLDSVSEPGLDAHDPRGGDNIPTDLAKIRNIGDLPIVVTTRMSLSFPILIASIPLYYPLFGRVGDEKNVVVRYQRHWFSDGGICSNFPIDFFDGPIPKWPTFGINLRAWPKQSQPNEDPASRLRLTQGNDTSTRDTWRPVTETNGGNAILTFLSAIIDTMQGWNDNTRIQMDGIYDRVVDVFLAPDEGGMNLSMPLPRVLWIASLGEAAGSALRRKFWSAAHPLQAPPHATDDWLNHCWVRLRNTFANLEDWMQSLGSRLSGTPQGSAESWEQLIAKSVGAKSHGYDLASAKQVAQFQELRVRVQSLGDEIAARRIEDATAPDPSLDQTYRQLASFRAPARRPRMGTRPRLDR